MKTSITKGIRFKLLRAFAGSITLSVILTTFLLFQFLKVMYDVTYANWSDWCNKHLNLNACILMIAFLIFICITTVFFYIFTRKTIYNINDINKNINEISKGNFNINIKVNTDDEIGQIAKNINTMSQKLEDLIKKDRESEKLKNDMISNISHDLRTPLTSVIGYMEIIKKVECEHKSLCNNCINVVLKKCDELKNLVEDLLEYTSINFKGIDIKKEAISIKDLIEQIMVGFIPTLEKFHMTFNINCQNEKPFIVGDINLIVRLFENIINNNIFYGKEGKKISIEIGIIKDRVSVKIINYGNKIPIEEQPYIFERFYRSEKSRNKNTGGKGMGLAIAKSIVEVHRGELKVASDDNETVFQVLLPKENIKL
ncbi:HAMP domain-containing sensor histidine kinase [Clostridium felsineum]|uniref:HAMP domain-containing sensor histidine kinase n=1 Tax=Clostridium felsineum TaxID=36839 RepID=UPI00098BE601|nr:HAMP domain-containing sensor histidine kinase [Clostridium felsineum]URZ17566.1 Adaptive-response sensory-kinase SasA [Clostridium felsineum DSM 794]